MLYLCGVWRFANAYKFLNVKGLVEEFKEFVRPKSIKERMEDKQKRVETQKKQTVMKHVSRRKEDIAI